MIIHFICRGNCFRSRMVETYLNSLNLESIKAISSGTVAIAHSHGNTKNFELMLEFIGTVGLSAFAKPNYDQLTIEQLRQGDLTIFMNNAVATECQSLFPLQVASETWDIPDFDEIAYVPKSDKEMTEYIKSTFEAIVNKVDKLVQELEMRVEAIKA